MPEITVFLGYAAAAILLVGPARRANGPLTAVAAAITLVAIALHVWVLLPVIVASDGNISLINTLSLTGLMFALMSLPFASQQGLRGLVAVFVALAAVGAVLTDTAVGETGNGSQPLWQLLSHALLASLAWSLFAAASGLALFILAKDRYLKTAGAAGWAATLPPLETMERLMFAALTAGFALLSLAIFSGLVFVDDLLAQHLTHKTVLTGLAWIVFATLLVGRWLLGWRGRRAVSWTLAGFVVLLVGYFGSRIVLEVLLERQWG